MTLSPVARSRATLLGTLACLLLSLPVAHAQPTATEAPDAGSPATDETAEPTSATEEAPSDEAEPSAESTDAEPEASSDENLATAEEPSGEEQVDTEEPPPEEDPFAQSDYQSTTTSDDSFRSAQEYKPQKLHPPTPFDQGRIRVGLGLGWASTQSTDWLILGLGAGYYILDGLELGADTTLWVIGDPFIATITPGVRYVLHFVPAVKPYVGGFYRHYFVAKELKDTDSIGARGGVLFMTGSMSYFGGGVVYEHFLDSDLFLDRNQVYPEIIFALSF